jgi:hypothetical protein
MFFTGQASNLIFMTCIWSSSTKWTQNCWIEKWWKLHMRTARSHITYFCLHVFYQSLVKNLDCVPQALLQSDLIKSSSEERSLLKNLGSWLGKLTIGRNQTLRAKEIDPKILIVEVILRYLFALLSLFFIVMLCHARTRVMSFLSVH